MKRLGICSLVAVFSLSLSILVTRADTTAKPPSFKEIYDLIRAHNNELSEAQVDQAAVQAFVAALSPKVLLVGGETNAPADGNLLSKVTIFEGDMGYIRIVRVVGGLPEAVRKACDRLATTNKLKGLVLDLRYVPGQDYAAAVGVADLFLAKEKSLLDWGKGMAKSHVKPDALNFPLAVLVNGQTSGASEALAAILRETGTALVLGGRTAGQASIAEEYPLSNGQRLRIATAPIQLADGRTLSSQGLTPDITVAVTPEDERAYFADPFATPMSNTYVNAATQTGVTNRARRGRFNEAELVRERREGSPVDADLSAVRRNEPDRPVVHDPALARALDLLKGLAVVRQSRS